MTAPAERYQEERLLLAVVLGREEEVDRLVRFVEWDRVSTLADRELIGGYLHRRLETTGFARLMPPAWLAHLAAVHRKVTIDNLLLIARLRDGAGALAQAEVPFMVLKGGALLADLYRDPGMRALADLDLLVHRDHVPAAGAAFERLGWHRKTDVQIAARRCGYETQPPGACEFEIHWDLSQRYRFQADLDRIWKEARPFALDGIKTARLDATDEFVYLALHYAAHYFGLTVKWLIDLIELIRQRRPDWTAVGERARSWGGSAAVHTALLFLLKSAPELISREEIARAGRHGVLERLLGSYITDDPLRFLGDLPKGPRRLFLAAMFQDRMRDRIALAWLTQVRGYRDDD